MGLANQSTERNSNTNRALIFIPIGGIVYTCVQKAIFIYSIEFFTLRK
jgi:hypothetical protein